MHLKDAYKIEGVVKMLNIRKTTNDDSDKAVSNSNNKPNDFIDVNVPDDSYSYDDNTIDDDIINDDVINDDVIDDDVINYTATNYAAMNGLPSPDYNCFFNLSLQCAKYNAITNAPSTSTHSFSKEIDDLNSSSYVFKLITAIDLKLRSMLHLKGKESYDCMPLEIENLANKYPLQSLLYELSNNVLKSNTVNGLFSIVNIFLYVHSNLEILTKINSFLNRTNSSFPLNPNCAATFLKDLNTNPKNPATYILRSKLALLISLEKDNKVLNITKEDTSLLVQFYSTHLRLSFDKITKSLYLLKLENLVNDFFSITQNNFNMSNNTPRKRNLNNIASIPIERNSKLHKKSPSL